VLANRAGHVLAKQPLIAMGTAMIVARAKSYVNAGATGVVV
jgi:hypothetical protein